jgi:hypothetical protein
MEGRMRYAIKIISIILFLSLSTSLSAADNWQEYATFMDRFYYLNKQNFNDISCRIKVSSLNDSLAQVREQLKPLGGKIKIVENISEFSLNFNKDSGLTFNLPSFDVKIVSDKSIKDREKVETGIKYMKQGFQMQIDGVTTTISGLFASYILPKREDFNIKAITVNKDKAKIVYEMGQGKFTDIYKGKTCKQIMQSPSISSQANVTFRDVGEKLILDMADVTVKLVDATIDTKMSVEYQEVKNIVFPAKLVTDFKMASKNQKQEGQIIIFFENCEIK